MGLNLHGRASRVVSAVSPFVPMSVRVSTGYTTGSDGRRSPAYATPGTFLGSITGQTLTVVSQTTGRVAVGQGVVGAGVLPGTRVVGAGVLPGSWVVNLSQDVAETSLGASLVLPGQVQSLTYRDLQMLDGLNIQGTQYAIYISGRVDGVIRPDNKGGDLITLPDGTVWLVSHVLEYWPNWCKFAVTRQNQ